MRGKATKSENFKMFEEEFVNSSNARSQGKKQMESLI